MKRIILVFFLVALFAGGIANAIAGKEPAQRITIADVKGAWNVPAPYRIKRGPGLAYTSLVFDTLIWKNRQGELCPALASSWRANPERNSYTFTLQEKALWHDGKPVTVEDVIFTVDYTKKHRYPFSRTSMIDRAEKTADNTVEIFLAEEFVPFLSEIAGTLPILPAHIYKNIDDPKQYTGKDAAIGSGPYMLVSFDKAKSQSLLKANKDYYGGKPVAEELAIVKMPPPVAVEELAKGNINMIRSVPYRFIKVLKEKKIATASSPSGHPVRLLFKHNTGIFQDKNLRHAVAYAINRKELVKIGLHGGGVVANTGGVSFANPWHTTGLPEYTQDSARSLELFQGAGFDKNKEGLLEKDGKPLTLTILTAKPHAAISKIIAGQLQKMGITVQQKVVSRSALDANLETSDFDMALFMSTALGDPVSFARRVAGKIAYSDHFHANSELADIFKKNVTEKDPQKRKAMVDRAQQIYAEELPAYYLYMETWSTAYREGLEPFYTPGGILHGVPLPLNKLIFVQSAQ